MRSIKSSVWTSLAARVSVRRDRRWRKCILVVGRVKGFVGGEVEIELVAGSEAETEIEIGIELWIGFAMQEADVEKRVWLMKDKPREAAVRSGVQNQPYPPQPVVVHRPCSPRTELPDWGRVASDTYNLFGSASKPFR